MRARSLVLAAALALGPAACGSGDDGDDDRGAAPAATTAKASPDRLLREAAAAMRGVRSYHVEGTQTDGDGKSTVAADVSANGASRLRLTQAGKRLEVIVTRGATYLKANRAFWDEAGGGGGDQASRLLADRWVKSPESQSPELRKSVDVLRPRRFAHCLVSTTGRVTRKGDGELDGRPVVVLSDDGDVPGGTPGDLTIAAEGKPLPLRIKQTGPERPGKGDPRCGDDDDASTTTASDLRLSDFDRVAPIREPEDAIDLGDAAREQQGDEQVS